MLKSLGRGLSLHETPPQFVTFSLTAAMPAEFVYTRADTVSTYRNSTGALQVAGANAPRFDHDINGNALGLAIEGSTQNKLTDYNANPATTGGWSRGGDAASTLTVVTDPSGFLAAAKLNQVCTGGKIYKLDNSGGATDAYAESSATFSSTSTHTISAWVLSQNGSGTGAQLTSSGTSPATLDIPVGATMTRNALTLTPDATGDKMRIVAKPGKVVYFILAQMELNPIASSVIVTSGAAATRQQDICYFDTLNTKSWWNEGAGMIAVRYMSAGDLAATQYIFCTSDGANFNEALGLRIDSSGYDLKSDIRSGNASLSGGDTGTVHSPNRPTFSGMTWTSGNATIIGQGDYDVRTFSGIPAGTTRFNIGARNGGVSRLWGWIKIIKIIRGYTAPASIGSLIQESSDTVIIAGGQSLAIGHFYSQVSLLDTGRQKFIEIINNARPQDAVTMVSAATGSTAAAKTSNPAAYWWDLANAARGPALDAFYATHAASGLRPTMILWAQGEEDSAQIPAYTTRAEYKQALLAIFNDMRTQLGNIPVFIQRIGRRDSFANTGGIQSVREVQQELCAEYPWIISGAEIYDVDLVDGLHPTAAGYGVIAQRMSRKMLDYLGHAVTGVDGPRMTGATRSGTTVTVAISHDGGTDISPASAIEGFRYFDNSNNPVTITSALRADAATITLTLASAVAGTLYYGYDALLSLNPANVVRDNAAIPMPLQTTKVFVL